MTAQIMSRISDYMSGQISLFGIIEYLEGEKPEGFPLSIVSILLLFQQTPVLF